MNEELKKLKEEFEQRIRELEDKYKPKEEFPKEEDYFWYIIADGEVCGSIWDGSTLNKKMFEFGNVFKTEEEAEFEVERRKILRKLEKMGRPFEPDKYNFSIYYDYLARELDTFEYTVTHSAYGDFYFNTEEEAQQAINIIGEDRIKKHLFGVEEGDSE